MEKRTLLAVAICMGILVLWWKIFPPPQPPAPQPPAEVSAAGASDETAPASAPATPEPAAGASAGEGTAPAGETGVARRGPEELIELASPQARYVFSNWGGVLKQVYLKEERFARREDEPAGRKDPAAVMNLRPGDTAPLALSLPDGGVNLPEDIAWTVSRTGKDEVTFTAQTPQIEVQKRYRLTGDYRLELEVVVHNRSEQPLSPKLALALPGRQDPDRKGKGFWDIASASLATLVCSVNDDVERRSLEAVVEEPVEFGGQGQPVRWIASDDKYFAVAAVPHPSSVGQARPRCSLRASDPNYGVATLTFGDKAIPPGGSLTYGLSLFAGPKYLANLDQVKPEGREVELRKVVDVTFAVLSRPLLHLLKLFHGWVGNWGLAIILLTVFVKLLTFYPTQKAMMSGRKMQRLAPKMQELRKKFENDRQRLGVETMSLYKQHGVSPLGGCLPTLITMPIWIALFSTLNYSVELHRAPFVAHIHDLSARDPYFVTPLLMGAIMVLQMRMSPAGADPQQQKMMAIFMPIMFTGFSLFLPAGLALYTLTNSLLAILQQLLVNHLDRKHAAAT